MSRGRLILVGAGPGDTGLLTLRGKQVLGEADLIIYDYLVNPAHLAHARPEARTIGVGKGFRHKKIPQERIHRLILSECRKGRTVVRLKGGDPYLFGRGAEEGLFAVTHRIPYESVPGVTSATAVAAYAGVPLTHRHHNASVTFLTGHRAADDGLDTVSWRGIVSIGGTLVIYMGLYNLELIARKLREHGMSVTTPVCVVEWGTLPRQRSVSGSLADIGPKVRAARLGPPSLIIVGEVARLRSRLNWYERLPLFGRTVMVTRAREGSSALSLKLRALGAQVVEAPVISIGPPASYAALDRAIGRLEVYDWIVLTSVHGVRALFERLLCQGRDARALAGRRVACVGPETAAELRRHGIAADLVPAQGGNAGLLRALTRRLSKGCQVLLVRSAIAPDDLERGIAAVGARPVRVAGYTTQRGLKKLSDKTAMMHNMRQVEAVVFASRSAVEGLQRTLGTAAARRFLSARRSVCIGPSTAQALRRMGHRPFRLAARPDLDALVRSTVSALSASPHGGRA
ncbi:MAG: Siroheme synthase [Candidatus Omnitrophica bacterium]|nr:Siroheme synthase [Candidatus Omnitrophota bacterium]